MKMNSQGLGNFFAAVFIFLPIVILASCQSGPPQISLQGARAELSPAIYGEAMVTMTIDNNGGADVLKGVSTDIPGATAMLHIMKGERMTEAATVNIPGGKSTVFKMGGSHIMIDGMPRSMAAGSTFTMTLLFEKSGMKQLRLKLEKAAAMPM